MHQSTDLTPSVVTTGTPLPQWMLAALAFGLAPLMSGLVLDDLLASANTWLVALLHIETRADIHLVRLLLRVVLPALVMFVVLSLTPARRSIVMTPLALSLLLVENGLFLLHVVNQVSLYVLDGNGVLRHLLEGPAQSIALGCLIVAIALTAYSTAWHRSAIFQVWVAGVVRSWLRPV